jgi:hypothetical protein
VSRFDVDREIKRLRRRLNAGGCNRGLIVARAHALLTQSGAYAGKELRRAVANWDRLAGFAEASR